MSDNTHNLKFSRQSPKPRNLDQTIEEISSRFEIQEIKITPLGKPQRKSQLRSQYEKEVLQLITGLEKVMASTKSVVSNPATPTKDLKALKTGLELALAYLLAIFPTAAQKMILTLLFRSGKTEIKNWMAKIAKIQKDI